MTKKTIEKNRNEIFWNIINAVLAGAISFFSALLATGELTFKVVMIAVFAAFLVALCRFQEYWKSEKKEYSAHLFRFL